MHGGAEHTQETAPSLPIFVTDLKRFYFLIEKIRFLSLNFRRLLPMWSKMGLKAVIFAECIGRPDNHSLL